MISRLRVAHRIGSMAALAALALLLAGLIALWSGQRLGAVAVVSAGMMLLLGVLAAVAARSLRRELDAAIRFADDLAEGRPVPLAEPPADQIGELLLRLRRMAERVERRTAELQEEVGERRRMAEALRESEERYALAAAGSNDGLWDWDLRAHRVHYSPRWLRLLGLEPTDVGTDPDEWLERIHELDRERFRQQLVLHCTGAMEQFECEHRVRHTDGSWRWMLARGQGVHDPGESCHRIAGSLTDITQRKESEQQLVHDAFHDTLTGLPNRALFTDRLQQALVIAEKRPRSLFAVMFLDLDGFKAINDSVGHLVGDRLLSEAAQRLLQCVRPQDTVARIGGDEFAILLDEIGDQSDAVRVARRVQARLKTAFQIDGHELVTTTSIGIALSSPGYTHPEEMLRDADVAMYRAKALGKARHEIFDRTMHERSRPLPQLEAALGRAVERRQLRLLYQPIIALPDLGVWGFEALLRWQHPQRGELPPGEFLAVAEETGLIVPIGEWVLAEAVRQLAEWTARVPGGDALRLSINLSRRELLQGAVAPRIGNLLGAAGIGADRIFVELTEGTLMSEQAATAMAELSAVGVRLHVDEFGTGVISLGTLDRLPVHALKIARSFVARMRDDGGESELVRTVVDLAHNLGKEVIAAGVEDGARASVLSRLGCELAQGNHFARPLEPEAAEAFLRRSDVTRLDRPAPN